MTESAPTPWWMGAVIYHIYPRSFRDSNNDGIGDLEGVIQGLDHVASLGVDAIWLSPFFTSPQKDFGYDISDYCNVDPIFGTLADFDRLIARAHALGLRVIVDQVYCHTSDEHPWFAHSRQNWADQNIHWPKSDWYVWADAKPDGSPPSNWQSVFGGPAWEWDARRRQYYLHNFLKEQPQLNVHNRDVQDALLNAARFWLDRGVDGFRLDAINFAMHNPALTDNPPSGRPMTQVTRPFDMQLHLHNQSHPDIAPFLERVRNVLDCYPATFSVAEVTGEDPVAEMKAFTQDGRRLHSAYGFDFLYAEKLTPGLVKRALGQWAGEEGEGFPAWAFCNHDAPRAVSRWAAPEHREAAARQYLMLLLALRGCAFLYQGEELGLPQGEVAFEHLQDPEALANWPRTLGRDGARTPFPWAAAAPHGGFSDSSPWLPADLAQSALAMDAQTLDPHSMLAFTRRALRNRGELSAMRAGIMQFLAAPEPILAFTRGEGADQVWCVFNLSDAPTVWPAATSFPASARIILSSGPESRSPQPSDPLDLSAGPAFELPPFAAYWTMG